MMNVLKLSRYRCDFQHEPGREGVLKTHTDVMGQRNTYDSGISRYVFPSGALNKQEFILFR